MSAAPTQAHRNMAIATSLGDTEVMLESFAYQEELGRPFRLTAHVTTIKPNEIKIEDTIGQAATIRMSRKDKVERFFNGIVVRIVQNARVKEKPEFELTIVPKVWLLTHNADCRIFQKKTIPEIIKEVFKARGIDDALKDELKGSFEKHDYTVQYRESDFNFVSRLMEAEGIYYYFKHDNGKHEMVLCNDPSCHTALDGYAKLPFMPPTSAMVPDHVDDWRSEAEIQTKSVTLRAFDFKAPNTKPKHTQNLDYKFVWPYEVFDYPAEFHLPAEAQRYTRLRAEELASGAKFYFARTDCRGVTAGGKFELTDPSDQLRSDQAREYLVTGVSLQGSVSEYQIGQGGGGEEFSCTFRCIDAKRVLRPARSTPKPVITGLQTATVVGPSGEEIHTDQYGRVRAQFHWDRYGKADENSSCWIRVAQNSAGGNWGSVFLPRVGHEVLVEFLEGDPDRPIITGTVYNHANKPPYTLPDHKTRTVIKTDSSKGGGGFNEVRFEDKKDSEQIFVHAQKNMDVRVKHDSFEWIGNQRHLIVVDKQYEHVQADRHEKIDGDHRELIGKDHHNTVTGKEALEVGGSQSLTVKGDVAHTFKANYSSVTSQNVYIKGAALVIEGTSQISLKVGGNSVVIDSSGVTIKGTTVTIDGAMTKISSGPGSPPGTGSACTTVAPTAPDDALEADNSEPGSNSAPTSEAVSSSPPSFKPVTVPPPTAGATQAGTQKKTSWIEIELVDEDGKPVAGERYKIKLPDGSVADGTLGTDGLARVEGFEPGTCEISFPNLDRSAWDPA